MPSIFNEPLYRADRNYLHVISMKDENDQVFYKKQEVRLVEVAKFLENSENRNDFCLLAEGLRIV